MSRSAATTDPLGLFGTFCADADDIEVRCMLSFSLLGNHSIAAARTC